MQLPVNARVQIQRQDGACLSKFVSGDMKGGQVGYP